MTEPKFTFSRILPFVRASLKGCGEFDWNNFLIRLWMELEKAQVEGIARIPETQRFLGQVFPYDQAPHELKSLAIEAYFYLLHNGYASPKPGGNFPNSPNNNQYRLTERGLDWAKGFEPFPDDLDGYMKILKERVPNLDSVTEQYVIEALTTFERRAFFASAVMLGAASEKVIYLLADALLSAYRDQGRRERLQHLMSKRKLEPLLDAVMKTVEGAKNDRRLPYPVFEGSAAHLGSLFEAIRVQRNDAVHPMNAVVSEVSLRHLISSFPVALGKAEELRAWFTANPGMI